MKGGDDFQALSFREACNKVIHASGFDFPEYVTKQLPIGKRKRPLKYFEPRLHCFGSQAGKEWACSIDIVEYCAIAFQICRVALNVC